MQQIRLFSTFDVRAWVTGLALGCGLLCMYVPTYLSLSESLWHVIGQGHGPLMLALTLWLAWQRWPALVNAPANTQTGAAMVLLSLGLLIYTFGRSQDILVLDVLSQLPVIMALILLYRGWHGVKLMLFPLLFSLTCAPIPGAIIDLLTTPLKIFASYSAESILSWANYPIGRAGVTLVIGPYKLLVADACAGLNSLFALEAFGIFYISMAAHTDKLRNILLTIAVVPVSIVSNILRIIALTLITYYYGDAVGQGFTHEFAGIFLFTMAAVFILFIDVILGYLLGKFRRRQQSSSLLTHG
jgi:exosortase B